MAANTAKKELVDLEATAVTTKEEEEQEKDPSDDEQKAPPTTVVSAYYSGEKRCLLLALVVLFVIAGLTAIAVGVSKANQPPPPPPTAAPTSSPTVTLEGVIPLGSSFLQGPKRRTEDWYGYSIALSADGWRVAVGSPKHKVDQKNQGRVEVYDWSEEKDEWSPAGNPIVGTTESHMFGSHLAMSSDGSLVAIADVDEPPGMGNNGQVRIYEKRTFWSAWSQIGQTIKLEHWVSSVDMSSDGTRVAIGVLDHSNETNEKAGLVQIYDYVGQWVQVGSDVMGDSSFLYFGSSLALSEDGNCIVVGATGYEFANSTYNGLVRVYDWTGSDWTQRGIDIYGGPDDVLGFSVDLSSNGSRMAIGAPNWNTDEEEIGGHVRIYDWNGFSWSQVGTNLEGSGGQNDDFGYSVALASNGNRVAIGARRAEGKNGDTSVGQVQIYDWTGESWNPVVSGLVGHSVGDQFGSSVAFSSDGSTVAIGAPTIGVYWEFPEEGLDWADEGYARVFNVISG